jgi:hypothetical protein
MRHVVTLSLIAAAALPIGTLGACRTDGDRGPGARPENAPAIGTSGPMPQTSVPYSGYPGPVGNLDAGAVGGLSLDGGAPRPPSTAQPSGRPMYPDAGKPR